MRKPVTKIMLDSPDSSGLYSVPVYQVEVSSDIRREARIQVFKDICALCKDPCSGFGDEKWVMPCLSIKYFNNARFYKEMLELMQVYAKFDDFQDQSMDAESTKKFAKLLEFFRITDAKIEEFFARFDAAGNIVSPAYKDTNYN